MKSCRRTAFVKVEVSLNYLKERTHWYKEAFALKAGKSGLL